MTVIERKTMMGFTGDMDVGREAAPVSCSSTRDKPEDWVWENWRMFDFLRHVFYPLFSTI